MIPFTICLQNTASGINTKFSNAPERVKDVCVKCSGNDMFMFVDAIYSQATDLGYHLNGTCSHNNELFMFFMPPDWR